MRDEYNLFRGCSEAISGASNILENNIGMEIQSEDG